MRPKITCHMITSLDGRLHPSRWSDPVDGTITGLIHRHYDTIADRFGAEGWIVGRKTMAEIAGEGAPPDLLDTPQVRPPHRANRNGRDLAVAIDPSGRIGYAADEIEGDHAVAILSERVSDAYLAGLRETGVSYVFAGADGRELGTALKAVADMFAVTHLLLEGGSITNGAFLAAGLIDEVSTLICPAIDGLSGVPTIFEHQGPPDSRPAAGQHLCLTTCEALDGGVVWLRHEVVHG
ncbi:dihydrofolate reductase family protein [Amorphus sp. 3PC139-8]|uniref:dihydrofolate reductase family protein n=1 Tax=Amorphus sp. 3PC139-8 TaxID=2735676 RepID=UPI00345D7527